MHPDLQQHGLLYVPRKDVPLEDQTLDDVCTLAQRLWPERFQRNCRVTFGILPSRLTLPNQHERSQIKDKLSSKLTAWVRDYVPKGELTKFVVNVYRPQSGVGYHQHKETSLVLQLSRNYGGGELLVGPKGSAQSFRLEFGDAMILAPPIFHEVLPVTSGLRVSAALFYE